MTVLSQVVYSSPVVVNKKRV